MHAAEAAMIVMAKPLKIIGRCHFEVRTRQRRRKFLADRVQDAKACLLPNALENYRELKHDRVVAERGAARSAGQESHRSRFVLGELGTDSVRREIRSGGDAAVIYTDCRCTGGEGGCETCADRSIGDGGDGRNRGAPVRVDRDVLSRAVTEGASGSELLGCADRDGRVRGGNRDRYKSACPHDDGGGTSDAGCDCRNGQRAGPLCVQDAAATHIGELRFRGSPGNVRQSGRAAVAVDTRGREFQGCMGLNPRVCGRNRNRNQCDVRNRERRGLGDGAPGSHDGGASGSQTRGGTSVIDGSNDGVR